MSKSDVMFGRACCRSNIRKKDLSECLCLKSNVRCRLKKAEEQCNEPPMLKILQDQMEQMRNQYMEAILQEQRRAETAEKSVRSLSQAHEERVGALESNLADLSFTAASHDKNTRYYIDTIHSLKEKIAELSEENRSLNSKEEVAEISNKNGKEEEDAKSLVNNLISIWTQLLQLQKYSKNNFIIEELLNNSAVIHKVCFKRIKVLEDKIEYLNKEAAKDEKGNCQCGLKEQVDDLRERIRSMNSSNQMTETLHSHQVLSLKEELKKLRQNHEESLKNLEQECKVSVANLEQQLAEHCQRSLMTLQERDDEIHRLSKEIFKLNKEAEVQRKRYSKTYGENVLNENLDISFKFYIIDNLKTLVAEQEEAYSGNNQIYLEILEPYQLNKRSKHSKALYDSSGRI
ncbi:GRIP and coiled-coil domain-containing protein 1 [Armadillidium vulgare]|nr:GRIP and coiled-coil domain-containing protein 1 [Armadillidium vulgare]